jgi:hypothetical protein
MSTRPIPDSLNDFPVIYPPRFAFSYVIVREPNNVHVLFKAFSDNNGTVRLCEFASRAGEGREWNGHLAIRSPRPRLPG